MSVRTYDPKEAVVFPSAVCSWCGDVWVKICRKCNIAFCEAHASPWTHDCRGTMFEILRKLPLGDYGMDALEFDSCFDPAKISWFVRFLPATLSYIERIAGSVGFPITRWPRVRCMSKKEVKAGERKGKGHGLYVPGVAILKVNRTMPPKAIYLNLIHELYHHAIPTLTDQEINDFYVPDTYLRATGRPLDKKSWVKWRGTNPCGRNNA